jgi:hypothetical protein
VPVVAEFDGIKAYIYYAPREHGPPHFHAICGDQEAVLDMRALEITAGSLRRAQRNAVRAWAGAREAELAERWRCAMEGLQIERID